MNKTFRLAAAAMAIALTACTQNEVLQDTSSTNLIGFGTYAGQSTKAGDTYVESTSLPDGKSFGVMAYKYDATTEWATYPDFSTKFMDDIAVNVGDGGGSGQTFTYSPAKYWPITSKLSFLAYYPKGGTGVTFAAPDDGYPTINFTVQPTPADQVDLMYTALNETKDMTKDANGANPVALNFKHALTRLRFQAKRGGGASDDVEIIIKSVKVKDAAGKGIFTFADDGGAWDDIYTHTEFPLADVPLADISTDALTTTAKDVTTNDDANTLLMIPQYLTNVKIEVAYTQDGEDAPPVELALAGTEEWTANKSILYTLTIDPATASMPISFTATAGAWDGEVEQDLPPKMTAEEYFAAINSGMYPPVVDIIDAPTDWGFSSGLEEYASFSITFALTMSGITTEDIGADAFYEGKALTSFSAPNFTGSIGEEAFVRCTALTSFSAPKMEGNIGSHAFSDCDALTSFSVPKMEGNIGTYAFFMCDKLTSFSAPNMTGSIEQGAFNGCSSLTSFSAPKMTGSIEQRAFGGCDALTSFSAPNVTGSIGHEVFYHCKNLTSITLGAAGTADGSTINPYAFTNNPSNDDNNFIIGNCDLTFTATPAGTINTEDKTWTVNDGITDHVLGPFKSITVVTP